MSVAVAYAPNRYHRVQMDTATLNYAPTNGCACSSLKGVPLHCIIFRTATDFACGTGGFLTSWLKELEIEKERIGTTEAQKKYDNSIYGIEKKQFPYMLCITNMLLHGIDVPKIYHENSLLRDVLDYTTDDQFDVILMNIWTYFNMGILSTCNNRLSLIA